MGLIVCIALQATSFFIYVLRIDWKKAAEEVRLLQPTSLVQRLCAGS